MRVMISQPMNGLSAEEIRERRATVVARLEADGHEVVDTVFTETPPEGDNQALWYLGKSLQAIAGVDAVYFMEGWDKARGCLVEYEACRRYPVGILNVDPLGMARAHYKAIGNKSFAGMDELETVEDYEVFFTKLIKACCPVVFWEQMKGRPIMEMVAAIIDEAMSALKMYSGLMDSRCEICGKSLENGMFGAGFREEISIDDPETGSRFRINGIFHGRCLEHRADLEKIYTVKKQHLSFEDLTQLVFYAKVAKRKKEAREYLIAAMKNCIAGLEKMDES